MRREENWLGSEKQQKVLSAINDPDFKKKMLCNVDWPFAKTRPTPPLLDIEICHFKIGKI